MNESKEESKDKDSKFIPDIEIDVSKLPSRGLSYPKNAKVKYRTYMHGEIRKASTSTLGIENSLKNAIDGIDASFGVNNLTLMDAIYISILRKVSTLNSMKFEVPFMCSKCSSMGKGRFSHTDIEFNDVNKDVESLPLYVTIKDS